MGRGKGADLFPVEWYGGLLQVDRDGHTVSTVAGE